MEGEGREAVGTAVGTWETREKSQWAVRVMPAGRSSSSSSAVDPMAGREGDRLESPWLKGKLPGGTRKTEGETA